MTTTIPWQSTSWVRGWSPKGCQYCGDFDWRQSQGIHQHRDLHCRLSGVGSGQPGVITVGAEYPKRNPDLETGMLVAADDVLATLSLLLSFFWAKSKWNHTDMEADALPASDAVGTPKLNPAVACH